MSIFLDLIIMYGSMQDSYMWRTKIYLFQIMFSKNGRFIFKVLGFITQCKITLLNKDLLIKENNTLIIDR